MNRLVSALLLGLLLGLSIVLADDHGDHGDDDKKSEQEHKDEDYHKLSDRLDTITARLKHIDFHLDKRLSPKIRQKALSLEHRLEELEDDHCDKDHYDCGGQDNECISRLKVCDGHRDCRNGDDEQHCEQHIHAGDVFIGFKEYDHCGAVQPIGDKIVIKIHSIKHYPAFTTAFGLRGGFTVSFTDGKETSSYSFISNGYFSHSEHALVFLPPPGEARGVKCQFDGADWNKCVGDVTYVASLEVCARYVYFRKGHVPKYLLKH